MKRRSVLAGAAALALPAVARAQARTTLRYIPPVDLGFLDPHFSSAWVVRNHAYMVFDTLYGQDRSFESSPQMAEGHTIEDGGKEWRIRLREGLLWHDNTPVLARDCVASIRRWAARDSYGRTLIEATDELSAPDDRTIRFRLKRPFPGLADALGKVPTFTCMMMPERLAQTDPFKQIPEVIGSGPYRFLADERVAGARNAYARFAGYRPREGGTPDWTAGPKVAHFDRVEWTTIPDAATAAAALASGQQDWWDSPALDLLPMLRRRADVVVRTTDHGGNMLLLRPNCLVPPFDNPAVRRAVLAAIDQTEFMQAVTSDTGLVNLPLGVFTPGTPMASAAGMEVLTGTRDFARAQRMLAESGYKGERTVLMAPLDYPAMKAAGDVAADMLKKLGMNIDYAVTDWGTVLQRRAKTEPVEQGGWSIYVNMQDGIGWTNPAVHPSVRGNGRGAAPGWPTSAELEALRLAFFDAPDAATRKAIAARVQEQAFVDVPFMPVGQFYQPTAYRKTLTGVLDGFPTFWNVKRDG
jgi:peptide/nickel transport system substrate-binding protein